LVITPTIIDAGRIKREENISREALFINNAEKMVHWYLEMQPTEATEASLRGLYNTRYLSLFSKNDGEEMGYSLPKHVGRFLVLHGRWLYDDGYPRNLDGAASLELFFNGTGVSLGLAAAQAGAGIIYTLDDKQGRLKITNADAGGETVLAQNLPFGMHHLALSFPSQSVTVLGIRINGAKIKRAPKDAVAILPMSGRVLAVASEKARINISAKGLPSGLYNQFLVLNDEDKSVPLEVYFEVTDEEEITTIPIYRYRKGSDYILVSLSSNNHTHNMELKGYRADGGVVFSLFPKETPGTLPLRRLVLPATGGRYYFVENQQRPVPPGYVYEYDIGNIATSRIAGSRPLYRWYNRKENNYFFTTSSSAEGLRQRGYVFEEIVGYVR
jgi:hypothetical protein